MLGTTGRQVMKIELKRNVCLSISALWFGLAVPLSAGTIFDNTVNDLSLRFNPGTLEVGDEITLGGTERNLTYFSFEYWGLSTSGPTFAGNVQAEVRFYLNTGPTFNGYPTPAATPFYDSGLFAVPSPTERNTFVFTPGSDNIPSDGLFYPRRTLLGPFNSREWEQATRSGWTFTRLQLSAQKSGISAIIGSTTGVGRC
jgi:hypothetical protein